ncbi:hypothetical protein ACOSQ3_028125 [Xanthoceras sorbifolium]
MCRGLSLSRCEVANVVHDVNKLLCSHSFISISFSPKCCNNVAHSVARWALGAGFSFFWDSVFPSWLVSLIAADFVGLFSLIRSYGTSLLGLLQINLILKMASLLTVVAV